MPLDSPGPEGEMLLKRAVFVCVENGNRRQMAEAFARIHSAGQVEAFSAGFRPSGHIKSKAAEEGRGTVTRLVSDERGREITVVRRKRTIGMSRMLSVLRKSNLINFFWRSSQARRCATFLGRKADVSS